jgi:hypothetical protein
VEALYGGFAGEPFDDDSREATDERTVAALEEGEI